MKRLWELGLGPAWAGNSVNCVPFRIDAVRTVGDLCHLAYYDAAGRVNVLQVHLPDGSVGRATIDGTRPPGDAHEAISLGVDRAGRVHLAFGAHNSTIRMTRSRGRHVGEGFAPVVEQEGGATYPMFVGAAGEDPLLVFRRGRAAAGEICVSRLSADADRWMPDAEPLISGLTGEVPCGPYLNTPMLDPDRGVHLFVVWRLPPRPRSGRYVMNVGIDHLLGDRALGALRTAAGAPLRRPVTPRAAERVVDVPAGANLINQASAALLPGGRPAVVSYWDDPEGVPQYQLVWRDGAAWRRQVVSRFRTRFTLGGFGTLPLPHSRPEMLAYPDGRILLIFRSAEFGNRLTATLLHPPDYGLDDAATFALLDEDLGFYEPVVDRLAWTGSGQLRLYVQWCDQVLGSDGRTAPAAAPARLCSWAA